MTHRLGARLTHHAPAVLSLFRVVFALVYAAHGSLKLLGWPVDVAMPLGSWPFWWAGLVEFIAGILILLGLFTRPAALIASGEMAVAYFWQHQPRALWPIDPAQGDLGGGEPSGAVLLRLSAAGVHRSRRVRVGQRDETAPSTALARHYPAVCRFLRRRPRSSPEDSVGND